MIDYRLIVAFDDTQHILATVPLSRDAAALRDFLVRHGIAATVRGEHQEWFTRHYGTESIVVRVLVPRSQLGPATQLLAEYDG